MTNKQLRDYKFLEESNNIEGEFSQEGFVDSLIAWEYAKDIRREINIKTIQNIHKRLMKRLYPRIAGKLRKVDVYVANKKCLSSELIYKKLETLCKFRPNFEKSIKEWHIQFEKIHPFEDGNGRVGRIIMNIQRINVALPILIIHKGKEQLEYYKWFE